MSEFFSPNFSVDANWKSTISKAFQQLRRVKFVVEDTFTLQDFDPDTDYNGMTVTNFLIRQCRYLLINKVFWYSLDMQMTLAAPLTAELHIRLPLGLTVRGALGDLQINHLLTSQAGVNEAGQAVARGSTNLISLQRGASGTLGAGAARFIGNGFVEVL